MWRRELTINVKWDCMWPQPPIDDNRCSVMLHFYKRKLFPENMMGKSLPKCSKWTNELIWNWRKVIRRLYLIFVIFLHSHILSRGNFTLGKCINLRQTEPKAVIFSFFFLEFFYTQPKNLHARRSPRSRQIWGMAADIYFQ